MGRDLPNDSKNIVSRIDDHGIACSLESEEIAVGLIGSYHDLPEHPFIFPFNLALMDRSGQDKELQTFFNIIFS
jgi:hypothetical protein